MLICEIFDHPYKFTRKSYDDGLSYKFKNANKKKVVVSMNGYHMYDVGWAYEISFGIDGDNELTGEGDEFRTFSTIMTIVDDFIHRKTAFNASMQPRLIFCTGNTGGRVSLYKKLLQRIIKNYPRFKLINPSQMPPKIKSWWKTVNIKEKEKSLIVIDTVYLK